MYVGTKIGFNLAKKFISVVPCNLLNLIRTLRSVHFARRTVHEGLSNDALCTWLACQACQCYTDDPSSSSLIQKVKL